ncbi:MAG: cytochrome C oxidase subunit I [Sulfurimonas sp. RIFOXYD12_FULL_33_39]|uniref:cbb3-type cytochrome c oxidase subunit I n=1 Tax=unclassified Sulfurimonas TaxID=2623549 RepID=UPI0008ABC410|nr:MULTISPECIES: cbb3-type cytochrome c oxidase subunit I [unclassified Sulfurimonas]OHE10778.1 MAG: cytochrome C oxidase subunit I [Sulfurimonas sp. RIFOXYD12_FULL_33_39]OHE13452.1 MAG: cytochrome C oxidase subunit I [Sulfurimonas sp. RIFOXYD2_FULL_34_21]
MSFLNTLINGNEGGLKTDGLTPTQKVTLRAVIVGILYYGLSALEGMMMRAHAITPLPMLNDSHYFSVMTVHPIVGIFGSTYLVVFGAFTFLVPYLMKKPLYSIKLANATWMLIALGALMSWLGGFIFHYAPLYTLYWPLPVDFSQYDAVGGLVFILGIALIMIGTLGFIYNIFATVFYTEEGHEKRPMKPLLISGLGIDGMLNIIYKLSGREPYAKEPAVSLPVVAIFRGTIDTFLDALVILTCGVLILVYIIGDLSGATMDYTSVNALLYKNFFWWGLDLIADGLVLIYIAGSWYLLAMLITGKKLFMQNIARAALLLELIVSWAVWSHHLLADQGQNNMMKLVSGEMVTAFELVTQGIAIFITLVTLWSARPLKMSNELKFLLGGILGFMLAVPAGIIQADMGLNRILHNTQWVAGPHFHVAILVGLTMTLYSAVYILWPTLTNGVKLYSQKMASYHFWAHLIGGIGMGAFMGMAAMDGALRRTLYLEGEYQTYMILAGICGLLLLSAWVVFLVNVLMSVGVKGLIGVFTKSKLDTKALVPEA